MSYDDDHMRYYWSVKHPLSIMFDVYDWEYYRFQYTLRVNVFKLCYALAKFKLGFKQKPKLPRARVVR